MTEIIPAILTDSLLKFKDLILRIEPYARRVHLDIADGIFVPNTTITGYDEIKGIETALKFDVHLMVQKPAEHLKEWFYTQTERFIIHVESEGVGECIKSIKDHGRKVILALSPETPIAKVEQYLSGGSPVKSLARDGVASPEDLGEDTFSGIQFMTVYPGFQGATFVAEVVDKISEFRKKYPDIMIMADGGITPETAPELISAGVSALVSGSYIVKSENIEAAIRRIQGILEG